MTSADFLRQTFFDRKKTFSSARPPEVRHLTFLFYSLNLLHKVTHIFWTLACLVALSAYTALILSSYSSSQDFVTHFLHFHLTMDSLCFTNGWLICTPITDFHRQVKHHARRTKKKNSVKQSSEFVLYMIICFRNTKRFKLRIGFCKLQSKL